MAGWSKIVDGCGLESFKAIQKVRKIEIWFDSGPFSKRLTTIEENGRNNTNKQFKRFLNKFLEVFLIEISWILCHWPLSPVFFDAQEIDLCNSSVREMRL